MPRLLELVRLLEAYEPCPEEVGARHEMLRLAHDAAADPFSRDRFVPGHYTASGFVLSPSGSEVLLVHHRRLARWVQPGGHIDPTGEQVLAAAIREIEEEAGIAVPPPADPRIFDLDVHQVPAYRAEPSHLHFDVRFLFRASSVELKAADEVHAAAWVPLDAVTELTTDRSVLRALEKLRS